MVTAELCYECMTRSFLIDECRITEFFSGYIVNFMKHVRSMLPDMMLDDNQSKPGKSILNVVADRPETRTTDSLLLRPSTSFDKQASAYYLLRLPVGDTAMCAVAGLYSSYAELLTVTLQYRNPIESSKLEATAAGSIAFIFASLQRST
ncbi:hypothetical protein TNCV_4621451 [Trichonephila clavipes]|nr:hypothetical protein TNCV_4621451 [Trichonephila clavipes]